METETILAVVNSQPTTSQTTTTTNQSNKMINKHDETESCSGSSSESSSSSSSSSSSRTEDEEINNNENNEKPEQDDDRSKPKKKTIITITKIHHQNKSSSSAASQNSNNNKKTATSKITSIHNDQDPVDDDDNVLGQTSNKSTLNNSLDMDDDDDGDVVVGDNDTFNHHKNDDNINIHQTSSTTINNDTSYHQISSTNTTTFKHRPNSTNFHKGPSPSSSSSKMTNNILMIDDLFVRKLLHQICPKHFDETWLQRFKQQYLGSFLGIMDSTMLASNQFIQQQRKRLESILSTNDLTNMDEMFVYWRLWSSPSTDSSNEKQDDSNENELQECSGMELAYSDSTTWIQMNRDPMCYLYNFCELLMCLEAKIGQIKTNTKTTNHNNNINNNTNSEHLEELCRQLAREIRAYLYWFTNDKRFQEDTQEQELLRKYFRNNNNNHDSDGESKSPSAHAAPVSSSTNNTSNVASGLLTTNASSQQQDDQQQQHDNTEEQLLLFNSIVKHLLFICHEMIYYFLLLDDDENIHDSSKQQSIIEDQRLKFFQIFFNLLSNSKFQQQQPQQDSQSEEKGKESCATLYSEWMKNLNQYLLELLHQQPTTTFINNNNKEQSQQEDQVLVGGAVVQQTPPAQLLSSAAAANGVGSGSSNPHLLSVVQQQQRSNSSAASSSSGGGPTSGVGSSLDSSSSSSTNATATITTYRDIFNNTNVNSPSPTSLRTNESSSSCCRFLPLSSAASSMTTPSPTPIGMAARNLQTPSSAPGNGTGNIVNVVDDTDRELSMLSMLNNCQLVDDLIGPDRMINDTEDDDDDPDDCCLPKLIAPPPPSQKQQLIAQQSTNANTNPSSNQFGFDFQSTILNHVMPSSNGPNPNNHSPSNNNNGGAFFSSNITQNNAVSTSGNVGNGNSFFNEFNIQSLFSSFDDNVSQVTGDSNPTITDHFSNPNPAGGGHHPPSHHPHQPQPSTPNGAIIKHYPDTTSTSDSIHPSHHHPHHNGQLPVNQCFTMTLDPNHPHHGHHAHQPPPHQPHPLQQPQHASGQNCFQQPTKSSSSSASSGMVIGHRVVGHHTTPPLVAPTTAPGLVMDNAAAAAAASMEMLCERQTLYRLIISQLLFDGHRNIACQVSLAEHIKCDSFLIGPSQDLHKLVTFAKAKKKEDILMDKSQPQVTPNAANNGFSRTGSSASFFESIGPGSPAQQPAHQVHHGPASMVHHQSQQTSPLPPNHHHPSLRLLDDQSQHPLQKGIFDHGLFGSNPGSQVSSATQSGQNSASILDSYGQANELNSSATELYSPSSGPLDYYFARSPEVMNNNNQHHPQQQSTPQQPSVGQLFSKMVGGGRSPGAAGPQSATPNTQELILTEAGLKNLNQLAKLNSAANVDSTNPLLGNGPAAAAAAAAAMMFGRSASAMASMTSSLNGATNPVTAAAVAAAAAAGVAGTNHSSPQNSMSRSPLTIKSPTSNTAGGHHTTPASHTTGNGKSHQIMQIVHKFGSLGQLKSQFSSPHGFCLGMNDEIIIADTNNHRICVYDKNGVWKQMFGNPGKDEGQLWYPRKITMIPPNYVRNTANSPYYVICDRGMERSRMQIFTRNGNFVRKIPIRYIDIVAGIAINSRGNIVVVDSVSPTIYVITIDNGTLIEWRDCADYMREPSDVAIYDDDYYICDFKGHCVVVINAQGDFIRKIGMEGLTSFPNGIDISPNGDIFVGDSHGNKFHVVVFNRDGRLLAEYECPYCKVSRCCGLKLTKDNNIVTLAKNNHHVLVLNPNFQHNQATAAAATAAVQQAPQTQQGQITAASVVAQAQQHQPTLNNDK